MLNKTKVMAAVASVLFAASAYAFMSCPIDGSSMFFTGKTTTEMGKLLKEYKCASGHTTWVAS